MPEQLLRELRALAYIHEHYAEAISRNDVTTHVGLSERHLTRCFRQEIGLTPIEYLNRYRVERAKTLLEAGDKSVTEVAMEGAFPPVAISPAFSGERWAFPRVPTSAKGINRSANRKVPPTRIVPEMQKFVPKVDDFFAATE